MRESLNSFFYFLFELVAPARASERVLRSLTLERLQNLARYDGTLPYHDACVRALVWELKYRGRGAAAALAGEYVSDLLLAEAAEELGTPLLLPMPMHAERRRKRGHNQTELLCEASLAFLHGAFDYAPNVLKRVRNTAPQQGLERHVRLKNVRGSMQVTNPDMVRGRFCIVVDDVSTTGATFAEARRALREAGARKVSTIALAQS